MKKTVESTVLVRFPDCDAFNHLNNARYLDYFMNAREDHILKEYGLNVYQYAAEKSVSWVVRQSQISYLRPAMLMEEVVIQSTLLHWGEKAIQVEMRMWDKSRTILKSLLWAHFTHVNMKTMRSETHSEELTARFISLVNPLAETTNFDDRIIALKGKTANDLI
jgi:YbgC/YbaW family acyl-CoA thioester hydrolase